MTAIPLTREPIKKAFTMALAVHLALIGFLWIGVSWRGDSSDMVEAEVWDVTVREAAPGAAGDLGAGKTLEPELEQQQVAATKTPEPKETADKVDIALENDKKAKAKALAQAKQEEQKLKQQQKKEAAERAKRAQMLLNMEAKRIAGGGGSAKKGPIGSGGAGKAARSTGPGRADASYIRKIAARIKANTSFHVPSSLQGNPPVIYDVELFPDGSVRRIIKRKSSGVAGFDEAVYRAIERSAPYPKDSNQRVPSAFTLNHKPKG